MRHAAFLFLGDELKNCALSMAQQAAHTGNADTAKCLSTLLWLSAHEDGGSTIAEAIGGNGEDEDGTEAKLETLKTIDASNDGALKAFFLNFFQNHVVLGTAGSGNDMLLTLVCKGHEEALPSLTRQLLEALSTGGFTCTADILMLAPDLAKVYLDDEDGIAQVDNNMLSLNQTTARNARELVAMRTDLPVLRHVILIQNCNEKGIALNLDRPTLARILTEYALTTMENYAVLYNQSVELANSGCLTTFGLSCLDFNRRYFSHYLLHHAYLSIMERENVTQTEVDINKVSDIASKCLSGYERVASGFFDKVVAPQLSAGHTPQEIVNDIRPKLDKFTDDLEKRMLSYIPDDRLSLPEKRAVLAQILVTDDDLLSGNLYDTRRLTFIDLLKEPIDYFVDANNRNIRLKEDEDGKPVRDDAGQPVIAHSVLWRPMGADGKINNPVERLKSQRIKIREASEYIRKREDELKEIQRLEKERAKSDMVVADDKKAFSMDRYRLVSQVSEHPLADDYAPEAITREHSIDLAPDFTPVKDQGDIGSCSVFAVTAVFEYIMKKNKHTDFDLSERFVYYNVRCDNNGSDSEGSALSNVIESMAKEGICLEKHCPYDPDHYNDTPTPEAYEDGKGRTIVKAMNIPVTEDVDSNVGLMRTAIAEGYPVIFGLKVFDGFSKNRGFVPMPDEKSTEDGFHAMVVVGFDDDSMLFKVRNSWGTDFGKKGYCFIPYAYLAQKQYLSGAYIITDISTSDVVKGIAGKHAISFDQTDNIIKQAIIASLIANKKVYQRRLEKTYHADYADFVHLNETLCDKQVRDRIYQDEKDRLTKEQEEARSTMHLLEKTKGEKLAQHAKEGNNTMAVLLIITLFFMAATLVCIFKFHYYGGFMWTLASAFFLFLAALIGFQLNRQKEYKRYKRELDEEIARQAAIVGRYDRQIAELEVRMFTYGMVLDSLSHLHNNLTSFSNSLKSYVNNLAVWYHQEKENVGKMEDNVHVPFVSLCDNAILDSFFDAHAEELTNGIKLYECMQEGQYALDEKRILQFRQGLRNTIEGRIESYLEGFNMFDYVNNLQHFPYLRDSYTSLKPLLQNTMQPYSQVLLALVNAGSPFTNIFIKYDNARTTSWLNLCKQLCGGSPSCGKTASADKLVVVQVEYASLENVRIFNQG